MNTRLLHLLRRAPVAILAAAALYASPAVVRADADPAPADPTLLPVYHAFGDKDGLVALMEDFMTLLVDDPRTRPFFADSDQKHVKEMLVDQFCAILGGPCKYTGKGMKEAHEKMKINEAAFNALVEDLQRAMDARGIPFRAQNKLLDKLAPMHREVINRP
jgi:hemoglobin